MHALSSTIIVLGLMVVACNENQQSGFSGSRGSDSSKQKGADAGDGDDSGAAGKGKNKGGGDDSGADDEGGDTDLGSEIDMDAGFGGDDKNDIDLNDSTIVSKIPGVEVIRVGVNFEDLGFDPKSDQDYNDAVLCFEGKFKVDGTNVVSIRSQTVVGTTFSSSGCNHKVRVEIEHPDGTKEPNIEFDSRDTNPVSMKFKTGSKLEVFMTPYNKCNPGVTRNMHQPQHAIVKPDVCNNSGG